jgi:hypothetical protein
MPPVKFKEYYYSPEGFDEWSERTGLYPNVRFPCSDERAIH